MGPIRKIVIGLHSNDVLRISKKFPWWKSKIFLAFLGGCNYRLRGSAGLMVFMADMSGERKIDSNLDDPSLATNYRVKINNISSLKTICKWVQELTGSNHVFLAECDERLIYKGGEMRLGDLRLDFSQARQITQLPDWWCW